MDTIETIAKRTSVRTYAPLPLDAELRGDIARYIATLVPPFGARVRLALLSSEQPRGRRRLGTYGVVSGARDFLAMAYVPGPLVAEAAAYVFEQAVLYCTSLGLGTCWIGGTLRKGDFARAMELGPGEELRIVSPVGYKAGRRTMVDSIFGTMTRHKTRAPFGSRFFDGGWGLPLDEQSADRYALPLEMVRLAPSASNKQPWRAVVGEGRVDFWRDTAASTFTHIDMGIALCHFEQTCRQIGVEGRFMRVEHCLDAVVPAQFAYCISWVGED